MCKYDDTESNIDEHNVMHLQNERRSIASAAAPSAAQAM